MKALNYLFIALAFSISASTAFAQKDIVPVKRTDESKPQSFYVNISVNHKNRIYEEGDPMTITVKSSKQGYLYLFYRNAKGNVSLIFPNKYHTDNFIGSKKKVKIPDAEMNFEFTTLAPFGKERLQAFVFLKPVNIKTLDDIDDLPFKKFNSRDLNDVQQEFERDIIVQGKKVSKNDFAEFSMDITTFKKGHVQKTKQKRVFVGICVAKFDDPLIPALPACEKDIKAVESFFNSSPAIDAGKSRILVNSAATKKGVRDLFFNYLPSNTNPGDEIIIYWTGRGARCSDVSGDEKDGYDETLVLYDSKIDEPKTQLIDDDFGRWMQNLSGRKVLFIMDTCHSRGMGNGARGLLGPNDDWDDYDWDFGFSECSCVKDLGQSNLALIASCAKSQVSLVRKNDDMSVMTWFVIDCLNKNRSINHQELYEKIKSNVFKYVKEEYEIEQNVEMQDEFTSPMILNP